MRIELKYISIYNIAFNNIKYLFMYFFFLTCRFNTALKLKIYSSHGKKCEAMMSDDEGAF